MRSYLLKSIFVLASASLLFSACDTTVDGELIIEDLVLGTGELGFINRTWEVNYIGTLEDGTVFDQSTQPYRFVYDGTLSIEGWNQGISGMRIGGKRRLTIPPHLAYGSNGAKDENGNQVIPKNATVIFEIEFIAQPDLEVEDLVIGDGNLAEFDSAVSLNYTCTVRDGSFCPLADGTFVDQPIELSFSIGIPSFPWVGLAHEMTGFHLGVDGMRVGGKRRLSIPPHLAYGSRGISDFLGYYVRPNESFDIIVNLVSASN